MHYSFPITFYLCGVATLVLLYRGWTERLNAWGIPMIVVVATASSWYLMDPIYNGYVNYQKTFNEGILESSFLEILCFLISLGFLTPVMCRFINSDLAGRESRVFILMKNQGIKDESFQDQIERLTKILAISWGLLSLICLIRTDFDVVGFFFPYLGEKSDPWGRGRLGSGLDAFVALGTYVQIMITALLGVTLALSLRPRTMFLSGICYLSAAPFYFFDRTRNTILAILLPGLLALITLRIRGNVLRLLILTIFFFSIDGWFKLMIETRDKMTMAEAFRTWDTNSEVSKKQKHLGFNMFEEMCYINKYIENGAYKINWGKRYFAELVNPIPRALWPDKPLIGIDYAIARGMAYGNQGASSGGVAASVSTGMIGQGVVNFGEIFGPFAAAFLMAVWIAVLARQDLMGNDLGHLFLYLLGLVLTYNMGRDITLLVIYPFVFGWMILTWMNRRNQFRVEI